MITRLHATSKSAIRPVMRRSLPTSARRVGMSPRLPGTASSISAFHSSAPRRDGVPKSPFQAFVDVLKEELKKNRELQENVKTLQGDVDKLQDSEAMKKAKETYERARVCYFILSSCMSDVERPIHFIFLRCSWLLLSMRTHAYELLLRSCVRRVRRLEMQCQRQSSQWKRAK